MMYCNDTSCGTNEIVCLPYKYRGQEYELNPYVPSVCCGLVKNVSADNPRRMDYYINKVATLRPEFLH